ncbi:MAG: DUF3450 family protein [Verrucomicrobiota bacterium]|nr:DUF3450 family protein [Verrucomicrobiota bacterium]
MIWTRLALALFLSFSAAAVTGAENSLNDTRSTLQQWVETRQLISRTQTDWQSDKEMLQQTIDLFGRELSQVEEQMGKLSTNNVQVEKERAQAEALLKASNEALEKMKAFAGTFEGQIKALSPRLPQPLQEVIKPLMAKFPSEASTKMAVTERVQLLVGILNELDKFNNAVSVFSEKQKNSKGEEIAVETVYVGLGAAYFVNEANDFAGMGSPGANGWEWVAKPELAPAVREILQIYRNEKGARFVGLPAAIR